MTSEQIKAIPVTDIWGRHEAYWLREIAYQLAVMNERGERTTPDNSSPEVPFVPNPTSN